MKARSPLIRLAFRIALVASVASGSPAGATERVAEGGEDPTQWKRLGSFRGSASSGLGQQVSDFLFEVEQDGDLYDDLGNLTLGLAARSGDRNGRLKWDNSFFREVQPLHLDLPIGAPIEPNHLSSYVDIQGTISRFRLTWDFSDALGTGDLGLGVKLERGWGLTVGRARRPLRWGDRPFPEVLAERTSDDLQELLEPKPLGQQDIVDVGARGIAAIARGIGRAVTPSADTERGKIFWDNLADPVTLFADVGLPIPADMFDESDPRLGTGDRIRHTTFFGFSPVTGAIGDLGLQFSYELFSRALRETTVVKEPDNHVLVSVRHAFLKGQEFRPLKFRPEVRVLWVVNLGYTFFEQRLSAGSTASSGFVYRIDLDNPVGQEAFRALLGEGSNLQLRPLRVAAERGEGAELVGDELRRGRRRQRMLRIRFFSPFRFGDRKTVYFDRVKVGDAEFDEQGLAKLRDLRKSIGRNRNWKKQFLVAAQGNLRRGNRPPGKEEDEGAFAVNLMTGYRTKKADAAEVRRHATLLGAVLGAQPVLEALNSFEDDERADYFGNLRISLGAEHVRHLEEVAKDRIWRELAEILLGSEHSEEWATPEARQRWRKRSYRRRFSDQAGSELTTRPQPTKGQLGVKGRFKLAGRTAGKFEHVRQLIETGDCLPCISRAFAKERDIFMLQMLLYRLVKDAQLEPGFYLEIYAQGMLSPVTLTNGVEYDFGMDGVRFADALGEGAFKGETETEKAIREIGESQSVWGGSKNLVSQVDARLRAGYLLLNIDPDRPEGAPGLKLRVFSDHGFSPELALRIDVRESKIVWADRPLDHILLPVGEPDGVIETPFASARFFYDIPLPMPKAMEQGSAHTLLLRLLNPEGLPVSEEQQLRFVWPETTASIEPEPTPSETQARRQP
jgi:hypothetical protein